MTTAHRPTFDPAQGKEAQRGPAYHQRLLPAHTFLKVRKPGQGGDADTEVRDLRAELLQAEAVHFAKKNGVTVDGQLTTSDTKRQLEDDDAEETPAAKRQRALLLYLEIDADSDGSPSEDSSDSESDEDEGAELMRELEKIKKERQAKKDEEEKEKAAKEQEQREIDIARGNPLLNGNDFSHKRRWDDDVVFKNQARGTEKKDNEFINDMLRSDFHKKFMARYCR